MKQNTNEVIKAFGTSVITADISRLLKNINCYARTGTVHTDPAVEEKLRNEYMRAGVYRSLWKLTKRETESDNIFRDLKERLEGRNPDNALCWEITDTAGYDPARKCIVLDQKLAYRNLKRTG